MVNTLHVVLTFKWFGSRVCIDCGLLPFLLCSPTANSIARGTSIVNQMCMWWESNVLHLCTLQLAPLSRLVGITGSGIVILRENLNKKSRESNVEERHLRYRRESLTTNLELETQSSRSSPKSADWLKKSIQLSLKAATLQGTEVPEHDLIQQFQKHIQFMCQIESTPQLTHITTLSISQIILFKKPTSKNQTPNVHQQQLEKSQHWTTSKPASTNTQFQSQSLTHEATSVKP